VNECIKFLEELNISKSKKLVVATSGGPDSMALLYVLKNNNYSVVCAHVNHNLRSVSDDEYIFVKDYCKKNDIPFEGMKINSYKNNKFTEEEARNKRYTFFEEVLKKYNTDILLTAHHGDDLIETILMRIIRGSNIKGYKGFSKVSKYKDFTILRPLVFYTKREIEEYIKDNNIPCVYDESNKSKKYRRNRIRLDILPSLKYEDKNIHKKFIKFSEDMEDIHSYFDTLVCQCIRDNYNDGVLNLNKFSCLDKIIQKLELEKILFNLYGDDIVLLNDKHVKSIFDIIGGNTNKCINIPKGIVVKRNYDELFFCKDDISINLNYEYILSDEVFVDGYGVIKKIDDTFEKSNYVIKLNSKEIKLPIVVRNRREHDFIEVKNMNGKKKIKNIFVDEKINRDKRDGYPIVTDSDGKVLWIPGIKKSKFDCYNRDFYDIIIKYIKKGE